MAPSEKRRKSSDHYHTGELILRLARDRHRGLIKFFATVVGLSAMTAGFYLFSKRPREARVANPPSATAPVASAPASASGPSPQAAPAGEVRLMVSLAKAAPVWLDGQAVGVKKYFTLTVPPGTHALKARFGRKIITESVTVAVDTPLSVYFDPRKKKAVVRPVP